MDVPHQTESNHIKKTWKGYFWEFLMLFLAVFCGFLAENIREGIADRSREKEYIESMVRDLQTDTANLSKIIKEYGTIIQKQDTLFDIFDEIDNGGNKKFVQLFQNFQGFPDFVNADGTIQQLKNAGGFRLLKNKLAIDSIFSYTSELAKIAINTTNLTAAQTEVINFQTDFISFYAINKAKAKGFDLDKLQEQKMSLFISQDKAVKEKLYGKLHNFSEIMRFILKVNLIPVKKRATSLIVFLQKEYRLEKQTKN